MEDGVALYQLAVVLRVVLDSVFVVVVPGVLDFEQIFSMADLFVIELEDFWLLADLQDLFVLREGAFVWVGLSLCREWLDEGFVDCGG